MMRFLFRSAASCGGQVLLVLILAGCGSVQYNDPINPKSPYTFPGQTAPAAGSTQPASAPKTVATPAVPAAATPAAPVVLTPIPAPPAPVTPAAVAAETAAVKPLAPAVASELNSHAGAIMPPGVLSVLRPGDTIMVSFSELPADKPLLPVTIELGEEGKITLPHNISVDALGKTPRQLEQEIRGEYVPKFYRYLTVTVRPETRYFHINGEVKLPAMYPWKGESSVLRAIGAAGGFTDWARRWQVQLTRANGQKFVVNCKKAQTDQSKDLPVFSGDYINVPRKNWLGY